MSARQPFLFSARPSSRAASRAAHRKQVSDQQTQDNLEAPQFGPVSLGPQNLKTSNLRKNSQRKHPRSSMENVHPLRPDAVARSAPRHSSPLAQSNGNVNAEDILIRSQNMSAPHLSPPSAVASTPFKVPDLPASRATSSLIPEPAHTTIECPVPVFPMAASAGDFAPGGTPSAHQLRIGTKDAAKNGINLEGNDSDDGPIQHLDQTNSLVELPFGPDGPRRMISDRENETERLLRKAKRSLVEGAHADDDGEEYVRSRKKSKDEYHGASALSFSPCMQPLRQLIRK
jgi:hypothetical protein